MKIQYQNIFNIFKPGQGQAQTQGQQALIEKEENLMTICCFGRYSVKKVAVALGWCEYVLIFLAMFGLRNYIGSENHPWAEKTVVAWFFSSIIVITAMVCGVEKSKPVHVMIHQVYLFLTIIGMLACSFIYLFELDQGFFKSIGLGRDLFRIDALDGVYFGKCRAGDIILMVTWFLMIAFEIWVLHVVQRAYTIIRSESMEKQRQADSGNLPEKFRADLRNKMKIQYQNIFNMFKPGQGQAQTQALIEKEEHLMTICCFGRYPVRKVAANLGWGEYILACLVYSILANCLKTGGNHWADVTSGVWVISGLIIIAAMAHGVEKSKPVLIMIHQFYLFVTIIAMLACSIVYILDLEPRLVKITYEGQDYWLSAVYFGKYRAGDVVVVVTWFLAIAYQICVLHVVQRAYMIIHSELMEKQRQTDFGSIPEKADNESPYEKIEIESPPEKIEKV